MLATKTKRAPTQAKARPMCKWRAITLRPMSNRNRMLKGKFQNGRRSLARPPRRLRGHSTFSSDCLVVENVRRLSRRLHRFAAAFNNHMSIQRAMNHFLTVLPLAIAQPLEIYVGQSKENFGSRRAPDREQIGSQCGETRATCGVAREWPSRRI